MLRNFRKPLVIATPKIGLKHPRAQSALADFDVGTQFNRTLYRDFGGSSGNVKSMILCSGKVSFDIEALLEKREGNLKDSVRVVRVEEIAPFPVSEIRNHMLNANPEEVVWVQEESMNEGAF